MSNDSKHKLFNYEVTPPAEIWQKISFELDESDISNQYPARLRQFEISPPLAVWDKISASLDPVKQFPVSEKRRLAPIFKYAAAAAIITLFIWGGIRFLNNGLNKTEIAKKGEIQVKQVTTNFTEKATNSNNSDHPSIGESSSNTEQDIRDAAALEESKQTYAKLDIPARSKLKDVSNFYFAPEPDFSLTRGGEELFSSNVDSEKDLADRYVMLMTPDGNIIRMSKKLGDFICCVAGEEQDPNCVNQIKSLQEKIANSTIGHSPGNFLDILNLVNLLQKNDQ